MNAIACRIRLALVIPLLTLPISNGTVAYSVEPPATALAFTSDGTVLVAGSQAGVLCYDWPDLTHPRNLNTHVANVQDLTFSPSQRYLAIAGGQPAESGVCEIVAWPEGHTVCTLESHQDVVCSAAWAPSSRTIATASMDTKVVVTTFEPAIRASEGRPAAPSASLTILSQHRLTGHSKGVLAVRFLANAPLVLTTGIDHSIRVWQWIPPKPQLLRTLENHTDAVYALALRPTQDDAPPIMASVGEDRTVRLWQPTVGRMMRFARLDGVIPLCAQWKPDGSRMVVGCSDGHVRVIDPETTEVETDTPVQSGWCYCLAIHPKSGVVVVGGPDGVKKVSQD
jgi:WD40 repeat protein